MTHPTKRRHDRRRTALKAVHRLLGWCLPPTMLTRRYDEIPGPVHVNDLMLASEAPEHVRHYVDDAGSAIRNIEESLAGADRTWASVGSCLDLPSGYGRVTRLLVRHLDPARLTVCDVDAQAVRFCSAAFGVRRFVAHRDPGRTPLPDAYDLVFTGSLLTHLPAEACGRLLALLAHHLRPGGLLIFTTQGEGCLEHLDWYGERFRAREREYRDAVRREGFCFRPYPGKPGYGVTIHAKAHVVQLMADRFPRLRPCRFAERGWDDHQDVWTFAAPDA